MAGFGSSDNSNDPPLCANNCGFFGNPATRTLCSVCYAAFLKENLISIPPETEEHSHRRQDLDRDQVSESDAAATATASLCCTELESKALTRKNRCGLCNKKIGLLGFQCRCGGLFCGKHRFQEEHGCSFDMKTVERERLAKENVEIKGDKLENRA